MHQAVNVILQPTWLVPDTDQKKSQSGNVFIHWVRYTDVWTVGHCGRWTIQQSCSTVESCAFFLPIVLPFCFELLACILSCRNKRILIDWGRLLRGACWKFVLCFRPQRELEIRVSHSGYRPPGSVKLDTVELWGLERRIARLSVDAQPMNDSHIVHYSDTKVS